ncbi:MAG: glucose 1-dehydrogenase [Solirubrobacteraceae bacterium]|jgi:NAD(P)-dependent dehydrogenase (short-subunit alcohol dehydrogenase family)|nr:glucose 1-dehydrogenase [Solirubrobacteraceae bacterium]
MALRFAAEGADVVVGDVRSAPREGGRPTVELILEEGGRGVFVTADAARAADVDELVTTAVGRTGRLDVMVPNAILAGQHSKGLLETSEEDWDAILGVGLRGVFLACRSAVRQMLGQEPVSDARGRIVTISSQHGMVGPPGHIAYAAAKGGVVNLTRQIAVDFGPRGIICNAVAPGKILTTPLDEPDTPETLAYSQARTPFPRLGRPEDVASLAVFLASDDCTYMSGANVMVDGGWMAY